MSEFEANGGMNEIRNIETVNEVVGNEVVHHAGEENQEGTSRVVGFDTSETEVKDITLASAYKEEGNELYRGQDYDGSIEKYSLAILHCPNEDGENKAVFLGNRAAAYYSIEEYRQVIDDCTSALELKPDYVKVLYRRAQVYNKLMLFYSLINSLTRL